MQLSVTMDPTNPRWETSEQRSRRSATVWKIIVGAAGASALTAIVVASCLDRDEARRDLEEPAYVETTSSTTTTTTTTTPVTTRDSTGGITPNGGAGTTTVTSAPMGTPLQPQPQP